MAGLNDQWLSAMPSNGTERRCRRGWDVVKNARLSGGPVSSTTVASNRSALSVGGSASFSRPRSHRPRSHYRLSCRPWMGPDLIGIARRKCVKRAVAQLALVSQLLKLRLSNEGAFLTTIHPAPRRRLVPEQGRRSKPKPMDASDRALWLHSGPHEAASDAHQSTGTRHSVGHG
jgi:hypothetical protein